jgi:alpha-mannosidase
MRWGEGTDGVTLLLDGIFAYNTGTYPQLTVLRSPIYGDMRRGPLSEDLDYQYLEQGIYSGRVRLIPEAVSANAAAAGAMTWQDMPVVVCEANHGGTLPPTAVGLSMEPACAVVTALKKAEDGNGYVLRLTEYDGIGGKTRLRLGNAAPAEIVVSPFEIKTLRFLPDGTIKETNMLEE